VPWPATCRGASRVSAPRRARRPSRPRAAPDSRSDFGSAASSARWPNKTPRSAATPPASTRPNRRLPPTTEPARPVLPLKSLPAREATFIPKDDGHESR